MWLDKCLKICVSENPSRVNKLKDLKIVRNLHGSTFTRFLNHFVKD